MVITAVPEPRDFELTGIDYLNLAADQVFSLYFQIHEIGGDDAWGDDLEEFWVAAQRTLASALALVEQGTQLLIKARIAAVSPFLLLSGGVKEWPKSVEVRDTPFAEFRAIDAHELIRAHNAVAPERLDEDFAKAFERLRRRRNTVMHTIDRTLEVAAKEIVILCLEAVHRLVGPLRWIELRRDYVYRTPAAAVTGGDWVESQIIREAGDLRGLLTNAELLKYFGFFKNQRRYACPTCVSNDDLGSLDTRSAQLRPNTPSSTEVYCFVCGEVTRVVRQSCPSSECKGNVLGVEAEYCLSCGHPVSREA